MIKSKNSSLYAFCFVFGGFLCYIVLFPKCCKKSLLPYLHIEKHLL